MSQPEEERGLLEMKKLGSSEDLESDSGNNRFYQTVKGVVGMLFMVVLSTVSRASVQGLDRSIPDFELNALRCSCACASMVVYSLVTRSFPWIPKQNLGPMFLICLLGNLYNLGLFSSSSLAPLATSECVIMTTGFVMGLLVFRVVNKEPLKWNVLLSVPLCVVGVVLVIQPEVLFSSHGNEEINNMNQNANETVLPIAPPLGHRQSITIGIIIASITGTIPPFEIAVIKHNIDFFTTENLFKTLLWDYLFGTILSLILMFIFEIPTFPTDLTSLALVFTHAGSYIFLLPVFFVSSTLISGNLGAIIRSLVIVFVLICQYTFLRNIYPGHRNWIEVLGAFLVTIGTVISSFIEIFQNYRKEKSEDL